VILRALAALALVLGLALFFAYLGVVGKAPWSSAADRHLRAMKDRTTTPASYAALTYEEFGALPSGLPLAEYARLEARGAAVEGYVQQIKRIADGDYGIGLVPGAPSAIETDTLPIVIELTPQWQRGSRNWRMDRLAPELRPHDWGRPPWPNGPRRVRISGWLLYDYPHDPHVGHGNARGSGDLLARRYSGWEIHPVTRIELWDDSLGAFVEWPR
jgi:hypothetical protein